MLPTFEWKRFWCPRGKNFDISDRGFLTDPDTDWGVHYNPDLVTFEQLANKKCVALLGEPGIGKSWALLKGSAQSEPSIAQAGGRVFRLDLHSFGSEDRLIKELFESQVFEDWKRNNYDLHLFLDSLDECLLRIDTIANLLADKLPDQPLERLRLRIVCRTAPWPSILETALIRHFRQDFEVYELVPLRLVDVHHAAERSGISDPEAFIAQVRSLDATALAIKPVTLRFLINTYLREGTLPSNQVELYEKGCRILCEESNESRQSSGQRGELSPGQRLAIASRIAGVTQFANRYAVWTGTEADCVANEDVVISSVVGATEPELGGITVSTDFVHEVLDTGLFSSRGANRIGWAHQTYAEFLAALYYKRHHMSLQQVRSLLFHPENHGRRLVPQLHELAAWVSVMNSDVLELVVRSDPEALLGAAAASLFDDQRKLVVSSLLDQCEQGRPLEFHWNTYGLYSKLKHPQLAEQLRPVLKDSARALGVRYVATKIAHVCGVEAVSADLADIALDTSEPADLRARAAFAVAEIGSEEIKARLRPLAYGEAGEDLQDDLKGAGLRALWPNLISVAEVFSLLTSPKQSNFSGTYSSFLDEFTSEIRLSDLSIGLQWCSRQPHRNSVPSVIDRVMDGVIKLAWRNVDHPEMAMDLAQAIVARIKAKDQVMSQFEEREFRRELAESTRHRRKLLTELLPRLEPLESPHIYHAIQFVTIDDFHWMVQRVLNQTVTPATSYEAKIVHRLVDCSNREHMDLLWAACQTNEILNTECKGLFEPIALDSAEARMLRDSLSYQRTTPELLDPPPSKRVQNDLQKIEQGQLEEWVRLTLDLSLAPTSTQYAHDLGLDLTELCGWASADADTKKRIEIAALSYIEKGDPQNDKWFNSSSILYCAIAGFKALVLLLKARPEALTAVSLDAWRKWTPTLLRYPWGSDTKKFQQNLLEQAYSFVPDEVVARILQEVERANLQPDHLFIKREIELCWDERMGKAIFAKANDPDLRPIIFASLLELLIQRDFPGSNELAESCIIEPPPTSDPERTRMLTSIEVLVSRTPDARWSKVWPIMRDNVEFGQAVLESITYGDPGRVGFVQKLTEEQLGQLYVWMVRAYGDEKDSGNRVKFLSPVDTAAMLRSGVLVHLKKKGTFLACEAIRKIMEELPEYHWLRQDLEEAESLARAATWQPISVTNFLKFAFDSDKRLVESGQQLTEIILESLGRLQSKLRGELPEVKFLWNVLGDKYRPKDEQDLSDYVASHLKEDLKGRGIIVNREVQIRRGIGVGTGQSTDIHVDAVIPGADPGSYESLYTIIEVKGNWNKDLLEAMKIQLRDRYLKDNRCRNGIYLVGWFSCPRWDTNDYRLTQCPDMSLEQAREFFSTQAAGLSTGSYNLKGHVMNLLLS